MGQDGDVTYTGEVSPGGPPDVRELKALTITKVAVDPKMSNNCYILTCHATGRQLLIDAADEPATILPLVTDLEAVVTTHQHWDHHRALAEVVAATGATTMAGADDALSISEQTSVPIRRLLVDGDSVSFGHVELEVIGLRGHTPGSIALFYNHPADGRHLFTGDSLFPGGVGNTFGDAESFQLLLGDVESRIFDRLPDDTWFYPGHGNDSTLGAERPHLAEWRERGW